jgi:hypothetical protein
LGATPDEQEARAGEGASAQAGARPQILVRDPALEGAVYLRVERARWQAMTGVGLVVVDRDGVTRPGWALRAGDIILRTDYDHDRRVMTAVVDEGPLPMGLRLRRWWEGRRW